MDIIISKGTRVIFVHFWLLAAPEVLEELCGWGVHEEGYVGLAFHVDIS